MYDKGLNSEGFQDVSESADCVNFANLPDFGRVVEYQLKLILIILCKFPVPKRILQCCKISLADRHGCLGVLFLSSWD